jgi:hypothetical protein
VLATGLGKTWLAAHDVAQVARENGRWPRVLFLAHRQELLAQAALTFSRLLAASGQPSRVGRCAGDLLKPEPLVVVASVQKLARADNLQQRVTKFATGPIARARRRIPSTASVKQAKAYCEWMAQRLPTAAEWQLAAGGTEKRYYPWGASQPSNLWVRHAS